MRRLGFVVLLASGCTATGSVAGDDDVATDPADTSDAVAEAAFDTDGADSVPVEVDVAVDAASDAAADAPIDVGPDAGCPTKGSLAIGETWTLDVDAHTGDEATTLPKLDANDGKAGDSPYFRRNNVARAHHFLENYWFSSKHQEAGEPSPTGPQWVDYAPPLRKLGAGRYQVGVYYRQSDNRAPYPAVYTVHPASGADVTVKVDQRKGTGFVKVDLGTHDLGCTGWVRVEDTGDDSIVFGKMELVYLGK